jgi:hypothetical protein
MQHPRAQAAISTSFCIEPSSRSGEGFLLPRFDHSNARAPRIDWESNGFNAKTRSRQGARNKANDDTHTVGAPKGGTLNRRIAGPGV